MGDFRSLLPKATISLRKGLQHDAARCVLFSYSHFRKCTVQDVGERGNLSQVFRPVTYDPWPLTLNIELSGTMVWASLPVVAMILPWKYSSEKAWNKQCVYVVPMRLFQTHRYRQGFLAWFAFWTERKNWRGKKATKRMTNRFFSLVFTGKSKINTEQQR